MFNQLAKHNVSQTKKVFFALPEVGEGAKLQVLTAGESNPEYFRAILKQPAENQNGMRKKKKGTVVVTTDADVKEGRAKDREMFAKYVVVGFVKIVDEDNEDVEFTAENAHALMKALPDWLFDELRNFCLDISNFTDFEMDVEDKVKN